MNKPAVKQLSADQRPQLERHFLKLGREDQRLRFGGPRSPESIRDYVNGIDFTRDALFGVFDADLELMGVAHMAMLDRDSAKLDGAGAELGVSVLEGQRGVGVGSALVERAHIYARNHALRTLYMHYLTENDTIMHIARKAGMRIHNAGSESEAWQELPAANDESMASEREDEEVALMDYALKERKRTGRQLVAHMLGFDEKND